VSNDARALHLVQPEPFSLTWTSELHTSMLAGEVPGSCCSGAGRGDHRVTGRVIAAEVEVALALVSAGAYRMCSTVCTFDMICISKATSPSVDLTCLWLNHHSDSGNTLFLTLLARIHAFLKLIFSFFCF
jgi:hypothetical protein